MLRPRVIGQWVGREEEDPDPLASEMLHPPVPRAKIQACWSGDNSPALRSVKCTASLSLVCNQEGGGGWVNIKKKKKDGNFPSVRKAIVGKN